MRVRIFDDRTPPKCALSVLLFGSYAYEYCIYHIKYVEQIKDKYELICLFSRNITRTERCYHKQKIVG